MCVCVCVFMQISIVISYDGVYVYRYIANVLNRHYSTKLCYREENGIEYWLL